MVWIKVLSCISMSLRHGLELIRSHVKRLVSGLEFILQMDGMVTIGTVTLSIHIFISTFGTCAKFLTNWDG